jgi:hypothetical protein
MSEFISNPLVNGQQISTSNIEDISKEYYNIYILSYTNTEPIDESIYHHVIDKTMFNNISKDLILIKAPIQLLKNYSHLTKVNILSKHILEKFNIYNYRLEEKNIVLPILNITTDNIKLYLSQFQQSNTLIDICKIMSINKYFNVNNNATILKILQNNISSLNESSYWTKFYNCSANLTTCFSKRKPNYYYLKNINKEFENYLKEIFRNNDYIDPSKLILSNEFKYKMNYNNIFNKDEIYELHVRLPEKEKFLLFCNLLVSKSYCHLILNNIKLLKFMKNIIKKYAQLFRYLIGYAWIRFYFEESIKKSYITKEDQFIFDIDTAAELPVYPFSLANPKLNPYMPILVSDDILNASNNIGANPSFKTLGNSKFQINNNGIANLTEFRQNLNIFCTGNPKINLFEGIEWSQDKIALGGSIMCACIQKLHPLVNLFNNYPEKDRLKRFFNEYYAKSDIDVMFLTHDVIDFMNKVKTFYNQIILNIVNNNCYAEPSHIKLECTKTIYLFVTETDIDNILLKNQSYTKEKIIGDMDNDEIKVLFSDILNNEIEKYKKIFFSKLSIEELNNYQINYPDYIDFNNINYRIRMTKLDSVEDSCVKTGISISFKYKIKSPHLDYPLELFMVKYNDFFATVQTFHLPCVRAYYDGSNVYLTPSCISAHLTYMNLDYKYFAGTTNPIEILNKYRMRGFGIWLNESEKKILIKYSEQNQFWNNLYNFNSHHSSTIDSNMGCLDFNHKLFQPRLFNIDDYYQEIPVDITQGYYNFPTNIPKIETKVDLITDIDNKFGNYPNVAMIAIINNLVTINNKGFIAPIEKWIIEASWNIMKESDNLNEQSIAKKNKYKKSYQLELDEV